MTRGTRQRRPAPAQTKQNLARRGGCARRLAAGSTSTASLLPGWPAGRGHVGPCRLVYHSAWHSSSSSTQCCAQGAGGMGAVGWLFRLRLSERDQLLADGGCTQQRGPRHNGRACAARHTIAARTLASGRPRSAPQCLQTSSSCAAWPAPAAHGRQQRGRQISEVSWHAPCLASKGLVNWPTTAGRLAHPGSSRAPQ